MTITEFLEARIAEDEAEAEKGGYHNASGGVFARDNYGCLLIQPARVLAECAAKRAIVEQVSDVAWGGYAVRDVLLSHLAAVYADHPGYNPEWAV